MPQLAGLMIALLEFMLRPPRQAGDGVMRSGGTGVRGTTHLAARQVHVISSQGMPCFHGNRHKQFPGRNLGIWSITQSQTQSESSLRNVGKLFKPQRSVRTEKNLGSVCMCVCVRAGMRMFVCLYVCTYVCVCV